MTLYHCGFTSFFDASANLGWMDYAENLPCNCSVWFVPGLLTEED